jgi:pectate lyase
LIVKLTNWLDDTVNDGINVRSGAQVLVESNVFVNSGKPLYTVDEGGAVANDNDFGEGENEAPEGTLTSVDYKYTLLGSENVEAAVVGVAGATLEF